MRRFTFGRKGPCPRSCGKSNKFTPILDSDCEGGGKCWSPKCGQRFIAPAQRHVEKVSQAAKAIRHHIYENEDDVPLAKVTITSNGSDGKSAVVHRWEESQWRSGLGACRPVPYRLPQTLEAIARERPVLIVEGEKDCDTAADKGFDATTNMFGAMKWRDEYSVQLSGVIAVIVSDNDDIGRLHGLDVEQSLLRNDASRVVHLDLTRIKPDLPLKGDLSDYFELGGTAEALHDEIDRLLNDDHVVSETDTDSPIPLPNFEVTNLPSLLRDLVGPLGDPSERMTLTCAALTTLGSIMPTVTAMYNGNAIAPMLYTFVVGQAGSGKSITMAARKLVAGVEDVHREYNRLKMEEYRLLLGKWAKEGKKQGQPCPSEPELRTLLLPPDSTSAVIIRSLSANPSILLFDSEADSLKAAFSAKNGDASAAFRKAFHHEPVSQARVGNGLRVHCDRPNLAMVLSGTHDQILPLIQGAQNGLASRFSFVQLRTHRVFKDPFDHAASLPNETAVAKAPIVTALYQLLREGSFNVSLASEQQGTFREFFREGYETNSDHIDDAVTLRSAVVVMRICIILTVLRCYENDGLVRPSMVVSDADFATAMDLGAYLRLSSGDIVERLRSINNESFPKSRRGREDEFFAALPESFTTADAKRIGQGLSLSDVTTQRYLRNDKRCQRTGHGRYSKTLSRPP